MSATISSAMTSLLVFGVFAAVVLAALRVAQSVFVTDGMRAAATELAAKLVAYPTGSTGVLRRRFARALTGQHLIMPSGERLAFGELSLRLAPEDLERLDPDGDVERLGADGARLYRTHARRVGWSVPDQVIVHVEVDPSLRSGWIPPARAIRTAPAYSPNVPATETPRADHRPRIDWETLTEEVPELDSGSGAPMRLVEPAGDATELFMLADAEEPPMTVASAELRLRRGSVVAVAPRSGVSVLGRRHPSLLSFAEPEVSGRHAALRLHRGRWEVKDLDSTNGTTLDGEPVPPSRWTPVRSGGVLALAGVRVDLLMDSSGTVNLEDVTTG